MWQITRKLVNVYPVFQAYLGYSYTRGNCDATLQGHTHTQRARASRLRICELQFKDFWSIKAQALHRCRFSDQNMTLRDLFCQIWQFMKPRFAKQFFCKEILTWLCPSVPSFWVQNMQAWLLYNCTFNLTQKYSPKVLEMFFKGALHWERPETGSVCIRVTSQGFSSGSWPRKLFSSQKDVLPGQNGHYSPCFCPLQYRPIISSAIFLTLIGKSVDLAINNQLSFESFFALLFDKFSP